MSATTRSTGAGAVRRVLPDPRELRHFLLPRVPPLQATRRRLTRALTIEDLRTEARRRVPRAVFDYTDGAADQEISYRRARAAFDAVEFMPRVLQDVSSVDTSCTLFGTTLDQPFVFAPTGFTRMMHHAGEPAVVRVAERRRIAYTLSTMGTTAIEDVAAAAPDATRWFQLYVSRDRELSTSLMHRAREAGYSALMLTVDVPTGGSRLRDARHGFSFPPRLALRSYADGLRHPAWSYNFLTTPPLGFASMGGTTGDLAGHMSRLFDPKMTIDDLAWIRREWDGPLIVKGVQSVADARKLAEVGVDGIVLSNHGGRQLDRAATPIMMLPEVSEAVGDRVVLGIDSGVMSGADIAAALASGASFVLIGRAYLYGLMAAGEAGVDRAAEILSTELARTMRLLGAPRLADLDADLVRLPARAL